MQHFWRRLARLKRAKPLPAADAQAAKAEAHAHATEAGAGAGGHPADDPDSLVHVVDPQLNEASNIARILDCHKAMLFQALGRQRPSKHRATPVVARERRHGQRSGV